MKNVNLNRRLFISMFICLLLIIPLASCKSYAEYDGDDNYAYSDYEFNNEESQFYMAKNTAAAENGYYYISNSPVNKEDYDFIYFYDMKNQTSLPLCSKLNCEHDSENCNAYITDDECAGNCIWYYKERLYMVERTAEKDLLVSYDKNGRDKKTQAELSVGGGTVRKGSKVTGGRLYYSMSDGDKLSVYSVSLTEKEAPKQIMDYGIDYKYRVKLDLYATDNGLYIQYMGADYINEWDCIYDYYDIESVEIKNCYNSKENELDVRGKIETKSGFDNIFYKDNSVYFVSVDGAEFIINRLNFDTKKCEEVYVLDTSEYNESESWVSFKGYDGTYMYIYEQIDPRYKRNHDGAVGDDLHVVDVNGKLVDKLHFERNEQFVEEKGNFTERGSTVRFSTFCCGDDRYILAVTDMGELKGLELSNKWVEKYSVIHKNMGATKKTGKISAVGVIDKKQIGTGSFNWINVTSK